MNALVVTLRCSQAHVEVSLTTKTESKSANGGFCTDRISSSGSIGLKKKKKRGKIGFSL